MDALLPSYRRQGVPENLLQAVALGAQRTREPITVLISLLWQATEAQPPSGTKRTSVPATRVERGIPLYALDKHTRLGRGAIKRFAVENDPVRQFLELHADARRRREAALMAAYYADAMPIVYRLDWPFADELEALGRETDLLRAGVPVEVQQDLCALFGENLAHLHHIRAAELSVALARGVRHG